VEDRDRGLVTNLLGMVAHRMIPISQRPRELELARHVIDRQAAAARYAATLPRDRREAP
jgi:hypothetical protein